MERLVMSNNAYRKSKAILAIIFNISIVVLEIIGVVLSIKRHGLRAFQFYTELSNYLTLFVSFLFVISANISLMQCTPIPRIISNLRFTCTTCLCITFIVVLLILIPMFPDTFTFMLFRDSNLYQHTLCPILSFVSFISFENTQELSKRSMFFAILPTIIYGITMLILNFLRIITGPYPFFYIYDIPWYSSTLIISIISLTAIFVATTLRAIHNRNFANYKTIRHPSPQSISQEQL